MKQLIPFKPLFNPQIRTLDFGALGNFNINRLYGIINVTRNAILYAPGAQGYGVTAIARGVITLETDTTLHTTTDQLNVYYETAADQDLAGQDLQQQILIELQIMNQILAQGLNIDNRDVDNLRTEYTKNNTIR